MATSRNVIAVEPYVKPDGAKRCKVTVEDESGARSIVPLHDLSRPELTAAARLLFPELPGNVWLRIQSEPLQRLIRENDRVAAAAAVEAAKGGKKPEPTPEVEAPKVESASKADKVAELLKELGLGGGVDPKQLAALVRAEVAKVASEIQITRVEVRLPDGDRVLPDLHHKDLPKVLALVEAGLNVFLVGPAGTGKSTIAAQVAEARKQPFEPESFGPDTLRSQLFGFRSPDGTYQDTGLYRAFTRGGLFLGDELDRGHPGVLTGQNQFLANGHCAFPCGVEQKHDNFRYIATANTYGRGGDRLYVGANQLDAATLDRFFFWELAVDEKLEERSALAWSTADSVAACREWIATVQRVRAQAADLKLPIVISPRASIDGCKAITTGALAKSEIIDGVLFKGAGPDIRAKLKV